MAERAPHLLPQGCGELDMWMACGVSVGGLLAGRASGTTDGAIRSYGLSIAFARNSPWRGLGRTRPFRAALCDHFYHF